MCCPAAAFVRWTTESGTGTSSLRSEVSGIADIVVNAMTVSTFLNARLRAKRINASTTYIRRAGVWKNRIGNIHIDIVRWATKNTL